MGVIEPFLTIDECRVEEVLKYKSNIPKGQLNWSIFKGVRAICLQNLKNWKEYKPLSNTSPLPKIRLEAPKKSLWKIETGASIGAHTVYKNIWSPFPLLKFWRLTGEQLQSKG